MYYKPVRLNGIVLMHREEVSIAVRVHFLGGCSDSQASQIEHETYVEKRDRLTSRN